MNILDSTDGGLGRARGSAGEGPDLDTLEVGSDPVLASLARARDQYLHARDEWERRVEDLAQAREEAQRARAGERQAAEELQRVRVQLARERQRTERQRERADRLAAALKDIHRALFEGNVFSLILKACLHLTGATRGLYVTVLGEDEFRIRAAVDVDGYPRAPLSPFLRALCRKVLADEKTLLGNGPEDLAGLPAPDGEGERFRNCLAAPVVLLKNLSGVVILFDKAGGDFDAEDAEVVLSVGDQAAVAVENQRLHHDLTTSYFSIVGILADAVEAKDPYTHGHCEMVASYAKRVAERMRLSAAERSVACYGGLLHDVGKIGISDGVLNKPGKLMPEEWELMRSHVRVGRDLLARVPALSHVSDVVLHHHERWDGAGYPDGLKGDQIGLTARIVCVVDAYCAMISKRSYKESSTDEQARAELLRCKGTHFDPAVVDAFLEVLDAPADEDGGPDGCGLPPNVDCPTDFRHAVQRPHSKASKLT